MIARSRNVLIGMLAVCSAGTALAQMQHDHAAQAGCDDPVIACADGSLWVVMATASRTFVVHSTDQGKTFSTPAAVHDQPMSLDWGPDARPQIAVDRKGEIFIAFNTFRDKAFNGEVFYTRSTDGGRSFAPVRPITANAESQRFQAIALDKDGA